MPTKLRFEKALLVLVALTALAIVGQKWVLQETFVLDPAQGFDHRLYSDVLSGGNTQAEIVSTEGGRYEWRCDLRPQFQYPYCGFEVRLVGSHTQGIDLSNYKRVKIWLDYQGPNNNVRIFLRNFNSLYSIVNDDTTTKYNQIEFPYSQGQDYYEFSFDDFFVANWWAREKNISPQLSHPEFSNVVSFDVQTGSEHLPGEHHFVLRRVELVGQRFDAADWYLAIIIVWAVLILLFLGYRVLELSGEVRERKRRELELIDVNELLDSRSRELEAKAKTDSLTGAFNREGIEAAIKDGLWEWRHSGQPLSIVMMDIDYFKSINDQYGHGVGDNILAGISALVKEHIRSTDLFARWGGEEFVLVCRNTRINYARYIADKLRVLIAEHKFDGGLTVTASFGVSTLSGSQSVEQLFKAADDALYQAKDAGRNCVVTDGSD
ncbi:GGDEF domain-containing protein [Gilvimarinus polysaccharolyticus]|uniref:GGDEF domain-containing protein n=1 Tax=Gilvimarinus polysaccharolyticus TaxID=863921 RepID=UPI000673A150|nr:GGDEF domain-containing protein [Gilvimarinus polysaccharolyticus]